MNTENLSTLKIHKLSQAQYDRELAAGRIDANALYLTPDEEAATKEHTHNIATTSSDGFMSKDMVTKLNGIAAGANAYTHPSYTAKSSGFYKVTVDSSGHVSGTAAVAKGDITGLGIPAQDTTYGVVSTSADGLAPKRDGSTTKFLRADGTWATPPDTDTKYTHPSYTAKSSGLYKVTVDSLGHVSSTAAVTKSDITGLGIPAQDTVYTHPSYTAKTGVPSADAAPGFGGTFTVTQPVSDATGHITAMNSRTVTIPNSVATTSAAGLMSATDKLKLDNMSTHANFITEDDIDEICGGEIYSAGEVTY